MVSMQTSVAQESGPPYLTGGFPAVVLFGRVGIAGAGPASCSTPLLGGVSVAKLRRRGGREAVGVSQPWNGVPGEGAPLVDVAGAAGVGGGLKGLPEPAGGVPSTVGAGGHVGEPADGAGVVGGLDLVAGVVGGNTVGGGRVAGGLGDAVGGGTGVGAQGR